MPQSFSFVCYHRTVSESEDVDLAPTYRKYGLWRFLAINLSLVDMGRKCGVARLDRSKCGACHLGGFWWC